MKLLLSWICICLTIVQSFLLGDIVEIQSFSEIQEYIQPDTLILLDIDDTLLIPGQMLGTDEWLSHKARHYSQVINDDFRAFQVALQEWIAIRLLTSVELVEEGTDKIIDLLQNNNLIIMGLTTQGPETLQCTLQHLHSLRIDLSKTSPFPENLHFMSTKPVAYDTGILFTNGSSKGQALVCFLEKIGYHPRSILFVDDKKHNLIDVGNALASRGVSFIGLRYSYNDDKKAQFSPQIAEVQWNHSKLTSILSDEEAQKILKERGHF